MENSNGYSLSDIAAIVGKDSDGLFGGNGSGFIILILFLLMMGGFGGYGWGGAAAGAATANAISNDFLFNNLSNQVANASTRIEGAVANGFANTNQNLAAGFNSLQAQGYQIDRDVLAQTTAINQTLCQGFSGVNANLNNGFNSVNAGLANLGYQMQQSCCDLKTALHAEGEMTRALITDNEVNRLRTDLQSAQLALSNAAQTQNLLSALGTFVPTSNTGCGCNCY